nr:PREDICTED: uncharacterized protein LOC105672410 [Linepithema humile]
MQYLRSKSKSKLKKREVEQTPTERIVSEIVKKGQPYKEIEAIFNDNRVIIRTQKEPIKEEYDPPCECISQDTAAKESTSSLKKCDDGVVFEMPDGNLELCRTPRDTSLIKKTCDQEETGCRTMTLYPSVKNDYIPTSSYTNERVKKSKVEKSLSLEENPNIFVLRIRNHSNNNDKEQKIDLEFRAPQPWRPKKDEKKERQIYSSEELEKHEENNDIHNHIKNDISEKLEEHTEDTAEINNEI